MKKTFSIITVCRNEENNINRTLDSIFSQMCKDFELVIIDGKSTDRTLEIINSYRDRIDVLISEKDSGIYNAMNKGILNSNGKYLIFMNAGDAFYDDNSLLEAYKKIQNNPDVEFLYGNHLAIKDNKILFKTNFSSWKNCYDFIDKKAFFCHQAMFFKRELFDRYGLYDENYIAIADSMFWLKCLKNNVKTCYIDYFIARFYHDGISSNNIRLLKKEKRKQYNIYFPFYSRFYLSIVLIRYYFPWLYKNLILKILNIFECKFNRIDVA